MRINPYLVLFAFVIQSSFVQASDLSVGTTVTSQETAVQSEGAMVPRPPSRFQTQWQYLAQEIKVPYVTGVSAALSGSLSLIKADYDNAKVRNVRGAEVPVSSLSSVKNEWQASQSVDLYLGGHRARAGWLGSITASPYSQQSGSFGYEYGFWNRATVLGTNLNILKQNAPESYYIDRDGKNKLRPRTVHGNEESIYLEQILTHRLKGKVELATSERTEERPRNYGVTVSQAYAFTERLNGRLQFKRQQEPRGSALKNERGYFTLQQTELGLTYEPIYDWLVSVSYALQTEREFSPGTLREVQVAQDVYGLGVLASLQSFDLSFQAQISQTNVALQGKQFTGGITWRL